jgi:hypothetical protein
MGGEVTMESMPGQGTIMRLILPLPLGDVADIQGHAATASTIRAFIGAQGDLPPVLLVEDHPADRTVLTHQLDVIGVQVETAEDGEQAHGDVPLPPSRTGAYGPQPARH